MSQAPEHGGRDEEATRRFVERFALQLTEAGMNRMASRVFSALLASPAGSCTAAELAENLQVSPAAISQAVRYLIQTGMIERAREPGQRRDQYRIFGDTWYETLTRRDRFLIKMQESLREGATAVGSHTSAGHRLDRTAEFFGFLVTEMQLLLKRWRENEADGPAA